MNARTFAETYGMTFRASLKQCYHTNITIHGGSGE